MMEQFLSELEQELSDLARWIDDRRIENKLLDLARKVAVEVERLRLKA